MRSGTGSAGAEEIVQEVMLIVWRRADLFDPHRAQVSSWIYQIARNRHIDEHPEAPPRARGTGVRAGLQPDAGTDHGR